MINVKLNIDDSGNLLPEPIVVPIVSIYLKLKGGTTKCIPLSTLYYEIDLIWTLIRSCFGSGIWRDDYKWVNNEIWKN